MPLEVRSCIKRGARSLSRFPLIPFLRMISFSQALDATVPHISNMLQVKPITLTTGIAALFIGYLSFVQLLRFKRYREVHKKYQHKYEAGKLTPEDAQKIMRVSAMYDMPRLLGYSLAFALFKTYGIVSRFCSRFLFFLGF